MPVGPLINALAVLLGGVLGAMLGGKVPERLRVNLPLTFGAASMGMGVVLIAKVHALPPVILALLLGSAIGELVMLEKGIERLAGKIRGPIERLLPAGVSGSSSGAGPDPNVFMQQFVGIVVLFCASGTGIFGALNEGMTGDYTVLLSKSFLDFCTALIFAASLGYIVPTIALPQAAILLALFFGAGLILPLTTPEMIADFSAAGGIVMLATGFRICGIKAFPVANMLPALVLVMPISHYWTVLFG
ncbi:DUF554 domain-containing protein [Saccharibacillus sp. CPCC 101409]|uniref:DUF554 domain-containing protein n=1 Tax=Saccharibacillus sp. CPCC 101409 TaxID=3058041 RepID=UPI0026729BF9|nr:DUF554 domain-containing protein [Saccharibacillus sp. CPCC 101409]MDO3410264.1 DUF554 domain-containing protein [Saccharibacillus sp. CPCC 101409]